MVFIPDSPSTGYTIKPSNTRSNAHALLFSMVRLISSPGNPSSDKSFINQEPYKLVSKNCILRKVIQRISPNEQVDGEILRPER